MQTTEVSSVLVHETREDIRKHARSMRHDPTRPEWKLWRWLRNRRFGDHKFRRQYPIGRYILDFYCHELKLAIELDGSPHEFRSEYDERRTAELRRYGITVVRFANDDLKADPDVVAARIEYAIALVVDARPSPGAARHPLPPGEGESE